MLNTGFLQFLSSFFTLFDSLDIFLYYYLIILFCLFKSGAGLENT